MIRFFSFLPLFSLTFLVSGHAFSPDGPEGKPPEGETKPAPAKMEKPEVKKIGESRFRLGDIEFDAKTKEISIPVIVNMQQGGPIEYILVNEKGKVHESIFTTTASPMALQLAMKLLKFQSGNGDLFNVRLAEEEKAEKSGKKEDRGQEFQLTVKFEGKEEEVAVHTLVLDGADVGETMTEGGWVYSGSAVANGSFLAEVEGSFIAVYLDDLAMFNMSRDGADNDERWAANDHLLPEVGKKGTLILKP